MRILGIGRFVLVIDSHQSPDPRPRRRRAPYTGLQPASEIREPSSAQQPNTSNEDSYTRAQGTSHAAQLVYTVTLALGERSDN